MTIQNLNQTVNLMLSGGDNLPAPTTIASGSRLLRFLSLQGSASFISVSATCLASSVFISVFENGALTFSASVFLLFGTPGAIESPTREIYWSKLDYEPE